MKHLYAIFITVFLLSSQFITLSAQEKTIEPDSIHISLLTCSPHQEVYSLYGHSALRYEDRLNGRDVAINYGMFNFNKPFFVLRFVFGLTDYEMGIVPFPLFEAEYSSYGSEILQQEINLTAEEKLQIGKALEENYKPENRVYRYNYFYDNCTTRARDIIVKNIQGTMKYNTVVPEGLTYRKMIHEMNEDHPWARLGNDLLLGVGADRELTQEQIQFLPKWMAEAVEKAVIIGKDGKERPLLLKSSKPVAAKNQDIQKEFPLTPLECSFILLAISIVISVIEWRTKRYLWGYDALLFLGQTVCSIILCAMIFSQHPTVSLNTQLLLFNPLAIIFGYKAIKGARNRKFHWLWQVEIILICLMLVCHSLNIQWIDPSIRVLALSLLLRCVMKLRVKRKLL